MKQSMNSSKNSSAPSNKCVADDSDIEDEDKEERSDTDSVPTDYQLSDTLMDQYISLINNQGLYNTCILVFIHADGTPVKVDNINEVVDITTLLISSTSREVPSACIKMESPDFEFLFFEDELRLGSIILHPSRCQVRDLKLVNDYVHTDASRIRCNAKERKQDHQHMCQPLIPNKSSKQLQAEDSNRQHNSLTSIKGIIPGSISPLRTTLEAVSQEESQLDWRALSRILQCQSRPPQPSCLLESQVIEDDQELQLATQEGGV
ncbi:hypothetical protein ACTFIU_002088 [Dictyostelium citrinum]